MRRRAFIILLGGAAAACLWPLAALTQTAPAMDSRHRSKLLQLLTREGDNNVFDPTACALLGLRNRGKPVPVLEIAAVIGKRRAIFSRVAPSKDDYLFVLNEDTEDPDSPGVAFRAHGSSFQLVAGIEFVDGNWTKMALAESAPLYAQQLLSWVDIIDAN